MRSHVAARVTALIGVVLPILAEHLRIVRALDTLAARGTPVLADLVADVRAQVGELIRPGFVAETGATRLGDLLRYLRAVSHRLERAPEDVRRDHARMDEVLSVEAAYAALLHRLRPAARGDEAVVAIGWMIEEFRVSLFAQSLGTAYPVSAKRILKAIAAIDVGMSG